MRKGDTGADVRELQKRLGIEQDGWYGDKTEAAVHNYQRQAGLAADGIAGSQTLAALMYGSTLSRHLTHAAVVAAAVALEVDEASILTVCEVESRGDGFLPDARPVILFERHIMYQRLKADDFDADSLAASYPNLVNQARGGYAGGTAEHDRFRTACGIDETCAIEASSWGLFQIMGYHWQRLGYGSPQAFMTCMMQSEDDQLDAFVRFITADPTLHKALKSRKWADFAKIYNGPAYRENLYDAKLSRAYERHCKTGVAA
ncbi:MAG: DUF3380 domain-containing protein [Nitrosomonadales bacterium]|nr:DUF3380 domain-containing protein [Nitrosomonadales bacterium]